MDLEMLSKNGFILYENEKGKYVVEKKASKTNNLKISPKEFNDFKEALKHIENILSKPNEWHAIVRFNRGLGIEYKNIFNILSDSSEDAKKIALQQVEKSLGNSIIEIRVTPMLKIQ